MRILVTGATGFIGYEVARQLAHDRLSPRLMVRRPERGLLLSRLDAELIHGDLNSEESLKRSVDGVDAVIHLAARATFEEYRAVRPSIVDGSERLIEAAAAAGVRSFVYGSSLFVYDSQSAAIDAGTVPRPRLDYGRAKLEAERRLETVAQRSGMTLTILRLPHVYGARDLFFSRLARGRVFIPGRKDNLFSHLHVTDAARALIAATRSESSATWPIADLRATTWKEFFFTVQTFFPSFRFTSLPAPVALAGAKLLRPFQRLAGWPTIVTTGAVVGWNLNLDVQTDEPWQRLGLRPSFPTIAEGVPDVLDDCVAFRWLHPLDDGSRPRPA